MADSESSTNLEQIATFFEDRIQTETAVNGTTVFIQRPLAKDEAGAATASAADLPDDFTVNTVTANSTQLYRVSFGPIDIQVFYDVNNLGAEILVNVNFPILGALKVADVRGNIKNGIEAAINVKRLIKGKVGLYLSNGSYAVLYWDLKGFGDSFKDEIIIFTI